MDLNVFSNNHSYSLYFEKVDGRKTISKCFNNRESANQKMYQLIGKYNLQIKKIWNDKHDKTYFCQDGSVFHINRV